jgi:hypothetical protein
MDDASKIPVMTFPSSDSLKAGQIDPKLLPKALKKMQGVVSGNGAKAEDIALIETPPQTDIQMARFKAKTIIKLVPQYGIKTEPGRNTVAELVVSDDEFRKLLSNITLDARTNPLKRQKVIDFIYSRSNKGFGIDEQRVKIDVLSRDCVQHQKCAPCANTGKTICPTCHGNRQNECPRCSGRRYTKCPKCFGDGKLQRQGKSERCNFCKGDGRINCTLCATRGKVTCQPCGGTGAMSCKVCASTGWVSQLAHIEVFAQIKFLLDRDGISEILAKAIEANPSRCVERHDIEVAISKPVQKELKVDKYGKPIADDSFADEPDDSIFIKYDGLCPFGAISFTLKQEELKGHLFGFQPRLIGFPFFLDKLTEAGQKALLNSDQKKLSLDNQLRAIQPFRFLREIMTQTLWVKNNSIAYGILFDKYGTGMDENNLKNLIIAAESLIRRITRTWRYIGLIVGMCLFALLSELYYLEGGRSFLKQQNIPPLAIIPIDILLLISGSFIGAYSSKFAAIWSRNKKLKNIVHPDVLKKTLPKAGKTFHWSIPLSLLITGGIVFYAWVMGYHVLEWLDFILLKLVPIVP